MLLVEGFSGAVEFGGEESGVEGCVVGDWDAAVEEGEEVGGDVGEEWGVLDVGGVDVVDVLGGEVALGVDECFPVAGDGSVGVGVDDGEFDDAVVA